MSADSGLPVYADVSNSLFFKNHNLSYRDVTDPRILVKNPERYFAWGGSNLQAYRSHAPHQGYNVLLKWCQHLYQDPTIKQSLNKEILANPLRVGVSDKESTSKKEYESYFVWTTNVDGYFKKIGFPEQNLCQTHGSYSRWQCSGVRLPSSKTPEFQMFDGCCKQETWLVPDSWVMTIDYGTNGEKLEAKKDITPVSVPSSSASAEDLKCWSSNWPKCRFCERVARPNIYQFGDSWYVENKEEENNLANWVHAVKNVILSSKDDGKKEIHLVMLEIGVGMRLPKIRVMFERLLQELPQGRATIIRINPEESKTELVKGASTNLGVINIPSGALYAIQKIDELLEKKKN